MKKYRLVVLVIAMISRSYAEPGDEVPCVCGPDMKDPGWESFCGGITCFFPAVYAAPYKNICGTGTCSEWMVDQGDYDCDGDGIQESCTPCSQLCGGLPIDLNTHCCVEGELVSRNAPAQGEPTQPLDGSGSAIPKGSGAWQAKQQVHVTPTQTFATYWTWDEYIFDVSGVNVSNVFSKCDSGWDPVSDTRSETTCGNSGAIPAKTVTTGFPGNPILSAALSVAAASPQLTAIAFPLTIASSAVGFDGSSTVSIPGMGMPGKTNRIQIGQTWSTKCWIDRATYPNGFGVSKSTVVVLLLTGGGAGGGNNISRTTPEPVATVAAGSTIEFTRQNLYLAYSYGPANTWTEVKCCTR